MSEPVVASGADKKPGGIKQRISYADLKWLQAFERIKQLGEGTKLNGWTVVWIHEDPDWIQLKRKHEKKMVRKGDPLIFELLELRP